jgi:hypothetical protein
MTVPPVNEIWVVDENAPDGVRRLTPDDVVTQLRAMLGQRLPGGCPDCSATHEYREDVDGIIDRWIHHSPTCPTLRGPDDANT